MLKQFIAYQGEQFTLEWYFDARGKSKSFEYFQELSFEQQKKVLYLFKLIGDTGKIFNEEKFRYEGNQIFAIKPSSDRFLCFFFEGAKIIITNAYEKKSQKMPPLEKEKALKAKLDYIERYNKGVYYASKKNILR